MTRAGACAAARGRPRATLPEPVPELPVLHEATARGTGIVTPLPTAKHSAKTIDGAIDDWRGTPTGFGGTRHPLARRAHLHRPPLRCVRRRRRPGRRAPGSPRSAERSDPGDLPARAGVHQRPRRRARRCPRSRCSPPTTATATPTASTSPTCSRCGWLPPPTRSSCSSAPPRCATPATPPSSSSSTPSPAAPSRAVPFGSGLTTDRRRRRRPPRRRRRRGGGPRHRRCAPRSPSPSTPTGYAERHRGQRSPRACWAGRPSGAPRRCRSRSRPARRDAATGEVADLPDLGANVANVAFRHEPVTTWFEQQQALALHAGSIDDVLPRRRRRPRSLAGANEAWAPGPGYHDRIFTSSEAISTEGGTEGIHQHYGVYLPDGVRHRRTPATDDDVAALARRRRPLGRDGRAADPPRPGRGVRRDRRVAPRAAARPPGTSARASSTSTRCGPTSSPVQHRPGPRVRVRPLDGRLGLLPARASCTPTASRRLPGRRPGDPGRVDRRRLRRLRRPPVRRLHAVLHRDQRQRPPRSSTPGGCSRTCATCRSPSSRARPTSSCR